MTGRGLLRALLGCSTAVLLSSGAANAQAINPELVNLVRFWAIDRLVIDESEPIPLRPVLDHQLLAKAQPDQCYHGLDSPSTPADGGVCTEGKPKTNQAYVWGLAQSNGYLYFGTIANTLCIAQEGVFGAESAYENPYWACAFDRPANDPYGSDWRPPRLFRYQLPSGPIEELSAKADQGSPTDPNLTSTAGIRSAGALGGVVFFAGPALAGGINVFAFDGATGELIAKHHYTGYTDIRQWLVVDGVLYTGVGTPAGGEVLRWRGTVADPLEFEEVGDLDGSGAYLAVHQGRLYISTWPGMISGSGAIAHAGVVRGPLIPPGGLTGEQKPAENWVKIWDVGQYDPDPVAAAVTAGGAIFSFEGDLYWGTMHVPFLGAAAALDAYCPEGSSSPCLLDANGNGTLDVDEFLATALGAHRSTTLFRTRHPEASEVKVDLVYGEAFLPRFDEAKRSYTIAYDAAHANLSGQYPQHGASGLGNFWNAYTWTMAVYRDHLFIGTFDWSELVRVELSQLLTGHVSMTPERLDALEQLLGSNFPIIEGADLFHIDAGGGKAWGETYDGLGNFTNYGLRTVLVDDAADRMYFGSANPMNLHPLGGWELIETEAQPK